ncbi:hypothetical protein LVQ71_08960 [Klebsiella pneumoniae]|uniref:hypothetical protein n=1 Tax=Klebsiella pneumoniae TaxID=573 RepID=UPI00240E19A1|nr:hypothetical protein [Klebsiella pneumoniae]WFA37084.1 hypothetical protein LVQ71_08960 [Klebsiella pneumoniae]HBU5882207.1 hypothetical protein [Klebsiella pneumoniae]
MQEFKGTPGPWSAVQQYVDEVSVIDGKGFKVVTAERTAILMDWDKKGFDHWGDEGGNRHLSGPEQFANAYLIATAPELLEALQLLMAEQTGGNKSCGHNGFTCTCPYDKARAAIAKALGK